MAWVRPSRSRPNRSSPNRPRPRRSGPGQEGGVAGNSGGGGSSSLPAGGAAALGGGDTGLGRRPGARAPRDQCHQLDQIASGPCCRGIQPPSCTGCRRRNAAAASEVLSLPGGTISHRRWRGSRLRAQQMGEAGSPVEADRGDWGSGAVVTVELEMGGQPISEHVVLLGALLGDQGLQGAPKELMVPLGPARTLSMSRSARAMAGTRQGWQEPAEMRRGKWLLRKGRGNGLNSGHGWLPWPCGGRWIQRSGSTGAVWLSKFRKVCSRARLVSEGSSWTRAESTAA